MKLYNYRYSTDYSKALDYMLDSIALDEPIKSRIDFRFDSFDDNYNELLKLNKLVVTAYIQSNWWEQR